MTVLLEDLQTISSFGPASGHVLDVGNAKAVVYEIRWNLSAAPTVMQWYMQTTNDVGITPDVTFRPAAAHWNLAIASDPYTIEGALQSSGRGVVIFKDLPRYVRLDTYVTGSVTGTITVRAYAR
jgi:hypothetical protein